MRDIRRFLPGMQILTCQNMMIWGRVQIGGSCWYTIASRYSWLLGWACIYTNIEYKFLPSLSLSLSSFSLHSFFTFMHPSTSLLLFLSPFLSPPLLSLSPFCLIICTESSTSNRELDRRMQPCCHSLMNIGQCIPLSISNIASVKMPKHSLLKTS